jgi:hypothetical protein
MKRAAVAPTAFLALACAHVGVARDLDPAERSPAEARVAAAGYSGIDLVERPEGLMVWRVKPGPLDGDFLASATLARGDVIVEIDGAPATLALWRAKHAQPAGTAVSLRARAGSPRGWRGQPAAEGAVQEVALKLEDETLWRGLLQRGELPPLGQPTASADVRASDDRALLAEAVGHLGPEAQARAARLRALLAKVPEEYRDPSTPPLLRVALSEPGAIAARCDEAVPTAEAFRAAPYRAAAELVARLAGTPTLELPPAQGRFQIQHSDACVWYIDFLLNPSRVRHAGEIPAGASAHPALRALAERRLDSLLIRGGGSRDEMLALQGIPALTPAEAAQMIAHFDVVPELAPDVAASETAELPEALRGAVEGTIVNASEIPELGWVVVGGTGANTYDLSRIAGVFELGGDDRYRWGAPQGAHRLVVDLAGNDAHSSADGATGPAAALGAFAAIDDFEGDDIYEGGALTAGAALGVSLLVDRAGNDRYRGGSWSLGAATGGAAIVLDLAGDDEWAGEGMSLGVGGPGGVGAVIDVAGNDRSMLGTRPSVYGVESERRGFGMGFGFGFRLAAAGGVGAYLDLAGDDRRTSGEFSQGCGYFLGLGLLIDRAGDDDVACDRYGLGGSAHQAAGVYIDLLGNDRYRGKTAVHLGGAWDESIGVFVEGAGDDVYEVASITLGGASNQSIALAIDRAGADRSRGDAPTLGAAGSNDYHFDTAQVGSLGVFLDLDGVDAYPESRGNDRVIASPEPLAPQGAGSDGVFLDRTTTVRPPSTSAPPATSVAPRAPSGSVEGSTPAAVPVAPPASPPVESPKP